MSVGLLGPIPASAAAECGWLAPSELDRLFPRYAPWRVEVGGAVGSCQFRSRRDQAPNIFGANQMVLESTTAAAEMAANLRAETAKTSEVVDRPELGEHGYFYSSGNPGAGARTISLVGHRGRVVVLALVSLQTPAGEMELRSILELVGAALAVADEPEVLAAASDCPWLEPSVLGRMLQAGGVKQQAFGENSCMAQDSANAVLLVSATPASPAMMARRGGGCTWVDLADLGPSAVLGYACSQGNPRATLRLTVAAKMIEYNLTTGSEPSEGQRQALVEMAAAVRRRLNR